MEAGTRLSGMLSGLTASPYLHEAAQPEDGVVEPAFCKVLLCACLHLHQGHLRMLLTVVY